MATLQAARMASLLRTINPMPTPAPLHYAISQSAPLPLDLPFSFPSPSGTTSNLPAFDFSGGDFQGFGDTSNFFEDLSSSNLLSLMGQQDQDMAWAGLGHGGGDWPLEGGLEFGTSG